MAKKAGKKSAVRRKKASAKKSVPTTKTKKAAKKSRVRKAAAPPPASFAAAAPAPRAQRRGIALADSKNGAINSCVNILMDAARPGWSDNGKMDTDYQYNIHSIRAFLSTVKQCLQGKHYNLDMNDDAFVTACLSAAVFQLKQLIYGKTT